MARHDYFLPAQLQRYNYLNKFAETMMTLDHAKKVAELQKLKLENITSVFGLIAKTGAAMGTVSVFVYCFFVVKFFPVGLQVGDTLFFLFVVLGMAITGALVSGLGFITLVPWVLKRASASTWTDFNKAACVMGLLLCSLGMLYFAHDYWAGQFELADACTLLPTWGSVSGVIICALSYFLITWFLSNGFANAVGLVLPWLAVSLVVSLLMSPLESKVALMWALAILTGGAMMAIGISALDKAGTGAHGALPGLLILVAAMMVPFVLGEGGKMLGFVFNGVGIRSDQATLVVNQANLNILQAAADAQGLTLYSCRVEEDSHVVSKVGILWHGIGERSYVALRRTPAQASSGNKTPEAGQVKVELDSAGVKKVEGTHEQSCIELRRAIYFDSGKATLTSAQWAVAQPVVQRFLSSYAAAEKNDKDENKDEDKDKDKDKDKETNTNTNTNKDSLVVTGFADPMADAGKGNAMLARQRACTVYQNVRTDETVKRLQAKNNLQILIDSRIGSNDAACDGKNNAAGQRACHEKDRRVELQLISSGSAFNRLGPVDAKVCDTP